MRSREHLLASAPLLGLWLAGGGDLPQAVAAAAASLLVDLDHFPDYVWWRRGWGGLRDFFASFHAHRVTRLALPAHSWELLLLAVVGLWQAGWPAWPAALVCGWAYHLAWDQCFNPVGWQFYFLGYRLAHGCDRRRLPVTGGRPGRDSLDIRRPSG